MPTSIISYFIISNKKYLLLHLKYFFINKVTLFNEDLFLFLLYQTYMFNFIT